LSGRRRLAAALEAAEHEDGRPFLGEVEARFDRPHELDELVVDDADDLLAGVESAQDLLADRPLGDPFDEGVGDRVVDVGAEQGLADFLAALADAGLGNPAAAAQLLERFPQASLNALEHYRLAIRPRVRRRIVASAAFGSIREL